MTVSPPAVLGVVLVLASVVIGARVVSSARHTYPVVAVTRGLAAGTVLDAHDVRLARVQLPGRGAGVYLTRLDDAVGHQLARPVAAGELLPAAALGARPATTTVTVPLESAAAPELRKGDRIELWVSSPTCAALVLLPAVTVQAVHASSNGSFGGGAGGQDVVISVAPPLADRVVSALALDDARLRAGVLAGDATGADDPLPELDGCAAGR